MDQKEILGKLARKEISKEEAEKMLAVENPGVDESPPPPAPKKSGISGCVIALLILIPLGLLLMLGACGMLFFVRKDVRSEPYGRTSAPVKVEVVEERAVDPPSTVPADGDSATAVPDAPVDPETKDVTK